MYTESIGIIRRMHRTGMVALPMELRRTMKIEPNDSLEVFIDGDSIVLKKYDPSCVFCHEVSELIAYKNKRICKNCAENICIFIGGI